MHCLEDDSHIAFELCGFGQQRNGEESIGLHVEVVAWLAVHVEVMGETQPQCVLIDGGGEAQEHVPAAFAAQHVHHAVA